MKTMSPVQEKYAKGQKDKAMKCPACGYIISRSEYFQARYDTPCPKYSGRYLSEFKVCEEKNENAAYALAKKLWGKRFWK